MKTSKPPPSDLSSSRRAQPLRQTRNNPPRASISGARPFGRRGSISGGLEEQAIEIFPAITHFADAITALPKELVRHFTLLKEVDAKIFAPEEDLGKLVDAALNAPPLQRPQAIEAQNAHDPTSDHMSAQAGINGTVTNGQAGSVNPVPDAVDVYNAANLVYGPGNLQRRQLFQHCAYTMQNMLVSLDEKNHVISTAAEALNKQLARIDDCFPYIELEISEEARYGSTTHWAYPENRVPKATTSRREIAAVNNLSAAAQHMAEEAAARSDARKQALLERKKQKNQHLDSDFDDHHDGRHKEKKLHGNSKAIRKAAEASSNIGLGITNGAVPNGNPPKRRKLAEKAAGAVMERSLSSVFGSNGSTTKKAASPRETPGPEGKKRQRAAGATNGQTRKRYVVDELFSVSYTYKPSRNNTITSTAMSPSLASSPIRTTFPESKLAQKPSPPPTNGGRPQSSRARQSSTHSILERPPASAALGKPNGNIVGTPDLGVAALVTGRSVPEVKATMKETANNSKGEHMLEDAEQDKAEMVGGLVVGNRKDSVAKREGSEPNGDAMQGIQTQVTVVTTKSGRASKPSTPAIPTFPEPVRSRSQRNTIDNSSNKRSHKKGAGAAAQLIAAQQNSEIDDTTSNAPDGDEDGEIDEDEPTYCYCNGVSYGEMVGCDADGCEREWFHLECVGLKVAPKGNGMSSAVLPMNMH
jgi:hypothetical protein